MADYTKEKLHVTNLCRTRKYIYGDESKRLIFESSDSLENYLENAKRLASCWNACIPFENPEQDIPKLVEALQKMVALVVAQYPVLLKSYAYELMVEALSKAEGIKE